MRLFIVERLMLRDLLSSEDSPVRGDVVAYFRDLQDPYGEDQRKMAAAGIQIVWAEGILGYEEEQRIDEFHDSYIQNWYKPQNEDISLGDGISFGDLLGYQYSTNYSTGHIVRCGEIIRKLLDMNTEASCILTDLDDGSAAFIDHREDGIRLLRRSVLEEILRDRGYRYRTLKRPRPLPAYCMGQNYDSIVNIIKRFVGGVRWPYLLARMKLRFQRKFHLKPRIYLFLNHGIYTVAEVLGRNPDLTLLTDQKGFQGAIPLRYDHLLAWPSVELVAGILRLRRHVNTPWPEDFTRAHCTFNGFDYGPLLQRTARDLVRRLARPTLIKVAQIRKLLRRYKPDCIAINGESSTHVRTIISEAKTSDFRLVFFRHGYVMYKYKFYPSGHNNKHVLYVANGTDHVSEYGTHLTDHEMPCVEVAPNPATAVMREQRERGNNQMPARRILALNFTSSYAQTVVRTKFYDRYTISLFSAARELIRRGYAFAYRPHHGDNLEYINFALKELDLDGLVEIDLLPRFEDAIMNYDTVIVNVTSCHYQALFAGWPTIFFEPDFDPRHFIGLPGATDVDSPIATTAEELVDMVEAAFDLESTVACFPTEFVERYAERFIGKDAGRAHEIMADFLARETVGNRLGAWRRPRNDKGSTGPRQEAVRPEIAAR